MQAPAGRFVRLWRKVCGLTAMRLAPPLTQEQARVLATVKLPCC
jgi:hypothetical protein